MELSSCNIKKFPIFSQKKAFLIFRERKTPQKCFIFPETETSPKIFMFQEELPKSQKLKFLTFLQKKL